jgi:hypothetical protein
MLQSRVPEEWRIPIAFAVVWVVPSVVAMARPSWWERAPHFDVAVALALVIVLVGALLQRSRVAWWILVVIYVGAVATWVQHVVSQGLGPAWTLWGVITLVNFALLISAPMRRFVRLRGRLAPGPR